MKLLKQNIQIPEYQWGSQWLVLFFLWDFWSSLLRPSTCVERDAAAFPKQGPLQPALVWQPSAYYQGGQTVVTARERDRQGQGSTPPLHHFYSAVTQTENLCSLSHASVSTSQFLLAFSCTFCLTESLALAHSPTSNAFQAENRVNLRHLTTSAAHAASIPVMRILTSPFRPAFGPFVSTEITTAKQSLHWKFGSL